MNPVELMLLTVLANAIVTGVIVYLIQKRIERSYTRQMEEFRASLQYSNFEQQTKFAQIYTKRVETLEALYQKFLAFAEDFSDGLLEGLGYETPSKEITELDFPKFRSFLTSKYDASLDECDKFFINNRLYLPIDISDEINSILDRSHFYSLLSLSLLIQTKYGALNTAYIRTINDGIGLADLKLHKLNIKKPNIALILHEMIQQVNESAGTLEKLYKSVANTANK